MLSNVPKTAVLDARFRMPCHCSIFTHVHSLNAKEGEEAAKNDPYFKVTTRELVCRPTQSPAKYRSNDGA